MKKEKLSEVGYLVLTIAIAFFVIISASKMSSMRWEQPTQKGCIDAVK